MFSSSSACATLFANSFSFLLCAFCRAITASALSHRCFSASSFIFRSLLDSCLTNLLALHGSPNNTFGISETFAHRSANSSGLSFGFTGTCKMVFSFSWTPFAIPLSTFSFNICSLVIRPIANRCSWYFLCTDFVHCNLYRNSHPHGPNSFNRAGFSDKR
ncbi:hypothetical protein AA313_de0210120 [Arthrobotrys entomopaga]|nr:hypothetical protein AA313_de0210120 [Arthrobotrys entomopaga]